MFCLQTEISSLECPQTDAVLIECVQVGVLNISIDKLFMIPAGIKINILLPVLSADLRKQESVRGVFLDG